MDIIASIKKNSSAFITRQFQALKNNTDANNNIGIIASGAALGSITHPHTAMMTGISMYAYNKFMQTNSSLFHNPTRLFMGIGLGSSLPGAFRSILTPINVTYGKIWSEFDHIFTNEFRTTLSTAGLVAGSFLLSQPEEDTSFYFIIGRVYQTLSEETLYSQNLISIINSFNLLHSLEADKGTSLTFYTCNALFLNLLSPSDNVLEESLRACSISLKIGVLNKLFDSLYSIQESSSIFYKSIITLVLFDTFYQILTDHF